jgi:hypothetical protein
MSKEQDTIRLFKLLDPKDLEALQVVLAKNFEEIENKVGLLQGYMKTISGGSVADVVTSAQTWIGTASTVDGWTYSGTTKIDGGNIQTDTIGAISIKTEELVVGSNIAMGKGAIITWDPTGVAGVVPPDMSAYATSEELNWAISDFVTNTHLTTVLGEDYVITGKIYANQIYSGTISGVTINVSTDLNVGRKIFMNAGSFTSDIVFNSHATMYSDPNAGSLILSATGGVFAGSQRIDQPIVAVLG